MLTARAVCQPTIHHPHPIRARSASLALRGSALTTMTLLWKLPSEILWWGQMSELGCQKLIRHVIRHPYMAITVFPHPCSNTHARSHARTKLNSAENESHAYLCHDGTEAEHKFYSMNQWDTCAKTAVTQPIKRDYSLSIKP